MRTPASSFVALIISLFTISSFALAAGKNAPLSEHLKPIAEMLKNIPASYEPDGAVCEQVARLQLAQEYPADQYTITGGIEYDLGDNTMGELDVVIYHKTNHQVQLVAEVKCWKNFGQGLDKAIGQRTRFQWNLQKHPEKMNFISYEGEQFKVTDFGPAIKFISISQKGGSSHGYDAEIPYTLSEMHELRMYMLKCQDAGECARNH